jgi:hypothetical protein
VSCLVYFNPHVNVVMLGIVVHHKVFAVEVPAVLVPNKERLSACGLTAVLFVSTNLWLFVQQSSPFLNRRRTAKTSPDLETAPCAAGLPDLLRIPPAATSLRFAIGGREWPLIWSPALE